MMKKDFSCQNNKMVHLREKGKTTIIEIAQVVLMTCEGYLTTIQTADNKLISLSKSLNKFEAELEELGFVRPNHNTLINGRFISAIFTGNKRLIILANDVEVRISRRKLYRFR
jgi:DNA-binding LytR/AlgR family response regulator